MSAHTYRQTGNRGLFDAQENLERLAKLGNPLEKLANAVDFEMFRPLLEARMLNHAKTSPAGSRPRDVLLMFKIILLKRIYNLSDEQAEYQINDRQSFKDFLGLASGDRVPDARTIWLFQNKLARERLEADLFARFHQRLDALGLIVNQGKMVDASFVEVPRQRNTREENDAIKSGQGAGLWAENPCKKRQKDVDARWTQKNGENHFGYKNHVKADAKSKLIDTYCVTHAAVHDSLATESLLRPADRGQDFYADNAYFGAATAGLLRARGLVSRVTERASRGHPLTDAQRASNRLKSKTRARVEHLFGFVRNSLGGFHFRAVGLLRARCVVGLTNLVYNLFRYEQIVRLQLLPARG